MHPQDAVGKKVSADVARVKGNLLSNDRREGETPEAEWNREASPLCPDGYGAFFIGFIGKRG